MLDAVSLAQKNSLQNGLHCPRLALEVHSCYNSLCCQSRAVVAELADAQDSGSCARQGVEVQVLSTAPFVQERRAISNNNLGLRIFLSNAPYNLMGMPTASYHPLGFSRAVGAHQPRASAWAPFFIPSSRTLGPHMCPNLGVTVPPSNDRPLYE